jgi:hypothetical protein
MAEEIERERAQLWAVYFGLRALRNPPPYLRQARLHLHRHLGAGQGPPLGHGPARPGRPRLQGQHLTLVGGDS